MTPRDSYSVFLPVVGKNELLEVYSTTGKADTDTWADASRISKTVAPLRTQPALLLAGEAAMKAAGHHGLKSPWSLRTHPGQDYFSSQRLRLTGHTTAKIDGQSAQLGLALLLLLAPSRSPHRHFIATGCIDTTPSDRAHDPRIVSVNHVREKLALVLELAQRGDGSLRVPESRGLLFFTPTHVQEDGKDLAVKDLPEVEQLEHFNIFVKPVAYLSDAVKRLHAERARSHWTGKQIAAFGGGMISFLLFCVWLFYWLWMHSKIDIDIESAEPVAYYCMNDNMFKEPGKDIDGYPTMPPDATEMFYKMKLDGGWFDTLDKKIKKRDKKINKSGVTWLYKQLGYHFIQVFASQQNNLREECSFKIEINNKHMTDDYEYWYRNGGVFMPAQENRGGYHLLMIAVKRGEFTNEFHDIEGDIRKEYCGADPKPLDLGNIRHRIQSISGFWTGVYTRVLREYSFKGKSCLSDKPTSLMR